LPRRGTAPPSGATRDATRDLKLVLNFIQLLVALQSSARGHVSERSKKCEKAKRLQILQWNGKEICHIYRQRKNNENQKPPPDHGKVGIGSIDAGKHNPSYDEEEREDDDGTINLVIGASVAEGKRGQSQCRSDASHDVVD